MRKLLPLLLQVPAALAIIAWVPSNWGKLAAFLVLWAVTFRKLSQPEAIFYFGACVFFTLMNAMSLKQGIFTFTAPDVLGMPVYELFMWGFYLLHLKRVLGGPAPSSKPAVVWTLALLYAAAFATVPDARLLLAVTGALLMVGAHPVPRAAGPGLHRLSHSAGCRYRVHRSPQRTVALSWRSLRGRALLVHHALGWCGLVHASSDSAHTEAL